MAENTVKARLQHAYKTESEWNSSNPILKSGEVGYVGGATESANYGRYKVGDGSTAWKNLPWADKGIYTAVEDKADTSHKHSASDITSGTFSTSLLPIIPVSKGGTGLTSLTSGQALIGNGTGNVGLRAIDTTNGGTSGSTSLITSGAVFAGLTGKANTGHTHSYLPLTGGTLTINDYYGLIIKRDVNEAGAAISYQNTSETIGGAGFLNDGNFQISSGTNTNGNIFKANTTSATFPGTVTATSFIGNLTGNVTGNVSGSSGNCTGNATSASQIYSTLTNPTTATTYYIPFHSGASSANKSLLNNNGILYHTQEGTTSDVGRAELGLGNNIASGTAGNKTGKIYLYGTSSGYTYIVPGNNTTSHISLTLPASGGTLARTADNVASASKWQTARTITLTGSVTGSVSIDGSGNVTLATTTNHNHDGRYVYDKADVSGTMNDAAGYRNAMGMINLSNPSSGTASYVNPNSQTGWHHFINMSYAEQSGSNMWQTQIANKAGSTDLWIRSRSGGTISNDTAWAAPWTRILTGSNWKNVLGGADLNNTFTGTIFISKTAMTLSGGKVNGLAAGTSRLYGNGIAISNPDTANDVGWIRVTGTNESDTALEIATGDDGGAGEQIVVRQYNTSNEVARQITLLNTSGNSSFPGTVTATTFKGNLNGTADVASKLTTSTVGGTATPIYLNAGVATACSSTIGSSSIPVYMNKGVITQCGTLSVNTTGSAATLSTARNINGTSFNGSADITTAKWGASRTITAAGDFTGSYSTDGSGNVSYNLYNYYSKSTVGNTNNYPYHRIAKLDAITSSYVDKSSLLYITQDYNGGGFGIVRISLRTNNSSSVSTVEAKWLVRSGLDSNSIQIGIYNVYGATYADVFFKCAGTYGSATIRTLASGNRGSVGRTWVLINSSESNDTTTSDKKTSSECWASIDAAATVLHSQAYSGIVSASDNGTVNYANSAGNASISSKLGTTTIGSATTPIYLNAGTATACTGRTVPGIKSASAMTTLGWGTNNNYIPDISMMAYWNGAYSGTSSNLAYCNKGAFGTIVTKNIGDYLLSSGGSLSGALTVNNTVTANKFAIGSTSYNNGFIELYGGTPFIDFHFNNSTADYTSRIIESSSGNININGINIYNSTIKASNWFRSTGSTGWYSEDYGGGIYMNDTNSVKVYNNKSFYCANEIRAGLGGSGQFRAVGGNYGFFIRNDGANTYFMLTNSGDAYGTWNSLRPLIIENSTGKVTIGTAALFNSEISSNGNIYLDGYGKGVRWKQTWGQAGIASLSNGETIALYSQKTGSTSWTNAITLINSNGEIQIPTKTGEGASGTWGINITGNVSTYSGTHKPLGSIDTDGQRVSGFGGSSTTVLKAYSQWGTAGASYSAKNIAVSSSDIRLKRNVLNTNVNALDMINSIKVRQFDWIDNPRHQSIGFVADELEELDPLFSLGGGYDEDGNMDVKGVDTFYMMGYVVKGMQEICAIDAEQNIRLTELDGKYMSHEAQIESLQQQLIDARQQIAEQAAEIAQLRSMIGAA